MEYANFLSVLLLCLVPLIKGDKQRVHTKIDDPPCFFNPLCICSKAFPDLGRVTCKNVPLLTIPQQINISKVFMIHLENNGLRHIEPYFFRHTGLSKIEISQNFLTDLKEETFAGLEISLWELNLSGNRFQRVPNQSFRSLQKLKILNLSENKITNVRENDWLGLERSLKSLTLSHNKLSTLKPRSFSILLQLETLDLSGNSLLELDVTAFKDGPPNLKELHLADNLLSNIPVQELSNLRELRHLDLSFNQITYIQDFNSDQSKATTIKLFLDTLVLNYNQIQFIPKESLKSFSTINKIYLNGNPIKDVEKNAFQFTKIQEIYLKDCEISELTTDVFNGLQNFLEILDLEGNNLTNLSTNIFKSFKKLKSLNLKDNYFKDLLLSEIVNEHFVEDLDLTGLQSIDFQKLEKFQNLRSLALSKISQPYLSFENLPLTLTELEELKLSYSKVKTVKSHAFKNFRGLRKLELNENSISMIENKAFADIGHSLFYLSLARGLSSSLSQLPEEVFEDLTAVEFLDLSNNRLKTLSKKLFSSMKRVETLLLNDNFIEHIVEKTFQEHIHKELRTIQLSFNQLSSIKSHAFEGLNKLEYLWLNDNKISNIEKGAFIRLPNLKCLYLQGNEITFLKEESFEDLSQLEKLDLAYNKIKTFNFNALNQVATFSAFTLNLSNNIIGQLANNLSVSDFQSLPVFNVNIKALDFSYNNISNIESGFFKPVESSATHLYLSHNKLQNLTKNLCGNLRHLQLMDISYNLLNEVEHDAFKNTRNIQVLDLSNNYLHELPRNLFKDFIYLRIINLRNNDIRSLPHNLFSDGKLERLDISNNELSSVPVYCFDADSAMFLSEMDLSGNQIVTLPSPETFAIFKSLYTLDLSQNRLVRIESGTFFYLRQLRMLDLSHNYDLNLDSQELTFHGLENVLEKLNLKNLSLKAIPTLRLMKLKSLDVSANKIFTISYQFFHNLSQIERLELSDNEIISIPISITTLNRLEYLGLSGNPLESINFQQSFSLRALDIRNTSFSALEKGALGKLPFLENLKLSVKGNTQNINIPFLIKNNHGLSHLHLEILEDVNFMENKLKGTFSSKLRNMILTGRGLKAIPRNLLQGIQSPRFSLKIFNTSVQEIPEKIFDDAKRIRNLTLDVRSNKLKIMANPNTGDAPNISKKTFLLNLKISDNDWICDCSVGWIEMWERKKRQYLCESLSEECLLSSNDLRAAVCYNEKKTPLTEVFKYNLECDWNSSATLRMSLKIIFLSMNIWLQFLFD